MYLKLFLEKFSGRSGGGESNGGIFRSITFTGTIIILLIVAGTAAYIEHGRGNIQKIKRHLRTPADVDPTAMRPGGQDPVILSRARTPGSDDPQFLSTTLLPGRGFNVLQINAYIPGMGEVGLLAAPTLADASKAMTGVDDDSEGQASLTEGAPFLMPWAGRLAGVVSMDGKSSSIPWKGAILNLPANSVETPTPAAYGGLLLNEASSSVQTNTEADGGSSRAVFSSSDVDDRWPSNAETAISVHLAGHAIEMTVDVKNIGDTILPVGVGWAPRFLFLGGDRGKVTLHIPSSTHTEIRDLRTSLPNGILRPVAGTQFDYTPRAGVPLSDRELNDTFVHLQQGPDSSVELRDPGAKFGLRITPLSSSIKAIHVFSPPSADYITISPQMNYDDPASHQWPEREDTGMVMLTPGQTVQWKIRLEIFPTK